MADDVRRVLAVVGFEIGSMDMEMKMPWGVHRISDIYAPGIHAGLPDGRWVIAIPEPYPGNVFERLRAAWWVFRERAYALQWPKAGDLETALNVEPRSRPKATSTQARS